MCEALGAVPTAVDELVRRCQVSAASVAEVLWLSSWRAAWRGTGVTAYL